MKENLCNSETSQLEPMLFKDLQEWPKLAISNRLNANSGTWWTNNCDHACGNANICDPGNSGTKYSIHQATHPP